jgi:teichuronic acid biosynthesis glycosyltransferase TuaG
MITILIPVYNGIDFLHDSITSVLAQTYTQWEVIIGVNGHPTNSQVYTDAKKYEQHNITVFDLFACKGKSQTLNEMVTLATYDYVAVLDVDDMWLPTKLEKQVWFIINTSHIYDVIGTLCIYFGKSTDIPQIRQKEIPTSTFQKVNNIINSSVIMKKKWAHWSTLPCLEDFDLWCSLAVKKCIFYNIPHVLTKHRIHPKSFFNTQDHQDHYKQLIIHKYFKNQIND